MSYPSWNGKDDAEAAKRLVATVVELKHSGIGKDLLIELERFWFGILRNCRLSGQGLANSKRHLTQKSLRFSFVM